MHKKIKTIRDSLTRKKIKDFEIYFVAAHGESLEMKQGKIDTREIKNGLGYAVRIKQNGRLGFSYGNDFSALAINSVIDQCREGTQFLAKDKLEFAALQPLGQDLSLFDMSYAKISKSSKLAVLKKVEDQVKKNDSLVGLSFCSLEDDKREVILVTSAGVECHSEKTAFNFSLGVVAKQGGDEEIAYDMDTRCHFDQLQTALTTDDAIRHALWLIKGKVIKHYSGPVIMYRDVVTELLEVLATSFFGENIVKKKSALRDKLGQTIYAPCVTLVDNGHLPRVPGSGFFDDEGSPCQSTTLVENGVLKNFLYDRYWAGEAKTKSTGNCRRENYSRRPELGPTNFYVKPGSKSLDQLISDMGTGIMITDVIGMHNADSDSGQFSVGVQGAYFERGVVKHAIKSMVLASSLHKVFAAVANVASDFKFYGAFGAASLLLNSLDIVGE